MDTRPSKRQRTIVCSDDDDALPSTSTAATAAPHRREGIATAGSSSLTTRPSRSKLNARSRTSKAAPSNRPSTSPSPQKKAPSKPPQSLHSFFQPATEGQRWSSQKFDVIRGPEPTSKGKTVEDDIIEDDYDSYDEIFTQHLAGVNADLESTAKSARQGQNESRQSEPKRSIKSRNPTRHTKRFLLPESPATKSSTTSLSIELDGRPWAQRFAPSNLDELAVHKRKVSDVQKWLEDVFAGRRPQRLLVLRGVAGCGKTTTVSLLSASLGFDVIEWKNPPTSDYAARDYVSASAQFEEFLTRGDKFGGLDLEGATNAALEEDRTGNASPRRVLLIEEFPAMNRSSTSLSAFRASLQRYLAASARPRSNNARENDGLAHPPIVIIVSETLLSSTSLMTENLTVHRLLGPNLYHHPGTTIIDFNKIAPTLMQKALQSILEKEARSSKRAQIPGPAVLDRISEIGDIRSAISSLEFLCLKGDGAGKWGGNLATKMKKSTRGQVALTPMEQESLKTISQREASLGMFHAVGKIVYNKREDKSLLQDPTVALPPPPAHLRHYRRDKVSQVSVNELIDETGTDISTFISALHENYPPSCEGHSFTDSMNDCIEALSDSDLLSIDRRSVQGARAGVGTGATYISGGIDLLRQDEIGFQVAARGLLFALPYPVNRKLAPENGRTRPGDAHKMFYPASLRLWREAEEVQGLVDSWMMRFLHPSGGPHLSPASDVPSSGVKSWSSRVGQNRHLGSASGDRATVTTMLSRHDALLYQLPYMAQIQRQESERRQLERITTFRATNRENTWDDGALDDLDDRSLLPEKHSSSSVEAPMAPTDEEEKLILSDDDIVD
ncbi:hypothetical protein N7510_011713 [Penicillium lagena]|uniref:uncharacterized protein n=1 Tax=Penicillium lagena TaxID=94218 RepID=UPI0025415D66|nr:uncharacterized protein N7510_011713 [Penicillium lagena]KAJ5602179.1 hypothetical protein N7510_011713 [Penicillium lagena]